MAETIVNLQSVVKHFESLPDPRHGINRLRLLGDVIAMAVYPTEEKPNEITVIPELIDQLDVKDAVVTIDAMGCQKKIAEKIVDSQADYVPAVKENQPKLHEAIKEVFSEDREDDLLRVQVRQQETSDKGHGRENQHCYVPAKVPDDFRMKSAWPG